MWLTNMRQDIAVDASPSPSDGGRACLTQSSRSSSTRSVSVSWSMSQSYRTHAIYSYSLQHNKLPHSLQVPYQSGSSLSSPLSSGSNPNLLSTCLMVCSILGSRPISFPSLFLLSSPSPTDWLLRKWIDMFLVVFGVVNLVKCPD